MRDVLEKFDFDNTIRRAPVFSRSSLALSVNRNAARKVFAAARCPLLVNRRLEMGRRKALTLGFPNRVADLRSR
jgi:hypothetical protein